MIIIALGSNLPRAGQPPEKTVREALAALEEGGDIAVAARSSMWRSAAWPDPSGPEYVNACAVLRTNLEPEDLLSRLHEIEDRFGRARDGADRWAARTLDLDLIDYDGAARSGPGLVLPHPRAAERAFVLLPLAEIAPDWRGPDGRSVGDLIAALPEADRAAAWLPQSGATP